MLILVFLVDLSYHRKGALSTVCRSPAQSCWSHNLADMRSTYGVTTAVHCELLTDQPRSPLRQTLEMSHTNAKLRCEGSLLAVWSKGRRVNPALVTYELVHTVSQLYT